MTTRETLLLPLLAISGAALAGCADQFRGQSMRVEVKQDDWSHGDTVGHVLVSDHYRIYTTTSNRIVLSYMPGFMEAAYHNYLKVTGLADRPQKPLDIYMMGTRKEWADLTEAILGPESETYQSIEAGGYCYNKVCVFWDMGGIATLGTASHEGLHQFLACRMKDHLPMWLEEGLCTTVEGYDMQGDLVAFTPHTNIMRFSDLRSAIFQDYWIPLAKLLPMDASDAVVGKSTERAVGYYGQLWALALFIQSEPAYRAGLKNLLADAEAGRIGQALGMTGAEMARLARNGRAANKALSEPIFRHYISSDLAGFEKQYRQFAMKLVKAR
ncbi:MAG: hypothetical protein ACE15C_02065 [Phycisphaerae bacterium]